MTFDSFTGFRFS